MLPTNTEFEEIYRSNYNRIYSFAYRLTGSTEAARSITQDTFYKAYFLYEEYDGSCGIYTWLCITAKDMFVSYLRKTKIPSVTVDLFISDLIAPLSEAPGYRLIKEVETKKLCSALDSMPKRYSDVLILRIYGEIGYDEIAKAVKIHPGSAKVIFCRAKKHIKEACINE